MNMKGIMLAFLALSVASAPALADEKDQVEVLHQTTLNLIRLLVQQGVLTKDAADKLIREAETSAARTVAARQAAAPAAATSAPAPAANAAAPEQEVQPGVVRVPFVPEVVKHEMKEEIKREVIAQAEEEGWAQPNSLPGWVKNMTWYGDFRLRAQHDGFPSGNATPANYNPAGLTLMPNTTVPYNYLRIQARLGVKAKVNENTFTDFRITTGSNSNPVSNNQTLGNGFNKYSLVLDRAYVQSQPYLWLIMDGGKMPNPWIGSDLVWDADVNFEGVSAKFQPQFNDEWNGIVTVGAFPYQSIQRSTTISSSSKWLYGAQVGAAWTGWDMSNAQFGMGLYDFRNVEGTPNQTAGTHFYDQSAAYGMQKGNTLMYVNAVGDPVLYGIASKFRELDITGKYDWAEFDPVHVMVTADYVKNLGYDLAEITQRTGQAPQYPNQTKGYQAVLAVGMPKILQQGDWQASVAYKYLEADAVLDALTDSNFHLGGTNAKGYILTGSYGLDDNLWLGVNWFSSDQISGAPLSIDTLWFDLNARF